MRGLALLLMIFALPAWAGNWTDDDTGYRIDWPDSYRTTSFTGGGLIKIFGIHQTAGKSFASCSISRTKTWPFSIIRKDEITGAAIALRMAGKDVKLLQAGIEKTCNGRGYGVIDLTRMDPIHKTDVRFVQHRFQFAGHVYETECTIPLSEPKLIEETIAVLRKSHLANYERRFCAGATP